ncbi:MAG: hypothetical protein ACO1N6_10405 [Microcella sp.]
MNAPKLKTFLVVVAGGAVLLASGAISFLAVGSNLHRGDVASSRAMEYTSAEQLVNDSDTIIEGVVISASESIDAGIPSTDLLVRVAESHRGSEKVDSAIIVTQHGNQRYLPEHPLLEVGGRYLLFLQLSETSPNSDKVYFYVTGVWAGMYSLDGEVYSRTWSELDRLPQTFTPSSIRNLVLEAEDRV